MNRVNVADHFRWEQLRAVEAEILRPTSPIPDDPFQMFHQGWVRASSLTDFDWAQRNKHEVPPASRLNGGPIRRSLRNRRPAPIGIPDQERRIAAENPNQINDPQRRPLSPTEIPGVRAIPKDFNRYFRGLLHPGEYFAKSITKYLGPFDHMPTAENVPAGDNYIILQRMGRLPESGKSIFRQVGNLLT